MIAEFRDDDGVVRDLPSKYNARLAAIEMEKRQKGLGVFIAGSNATTDFSL